MSDRDGLTNMMIGNAYEQMQRGNFREAYQMYQKIRGKGFKNIELLYNIAYCSWSLKEYREAVIYCDEALSQNPRFVHALNIKGNALDDLGNHKSAIESYRKAIETDPGYYEAWNGMGLSYKALGDREQAMKCYEEAINLKVDFFRAWYNKAQLLDDMDKADEAIHVWKDVIKIMETDDAWDNLGHCFFKTKQYVEAIHAFDQAIRLNPNSAQAWTNKGATLTAMNKFYEATECFKEALRIKPDFEPAKRNLERISQSLLHGGDRSSRNDSSLDGIVPVDVLRFYNDADAKIKENNYKVAVDAILKAENALSVIKSAIGTYNELQFLAVSATLFKKMKKWDEAIIRFKKVCQLAEEIEPHSWATVGDYRDLGYCCKAIGKIFDATLAFTKALAFAKRIDETSSYVKTIEDEIRDMSGL